jgi:GxxExxY protein
MNSETSTIPYHVLNPIATIIVNSAYRVHKEMGPGLLESVYQECMYQELRDRDLYVTTMVPVPIYYNGKYLNKEFVLDVLVNDEIILELKSTEGIVPVHIAQLLSYMKLANKQMGFLINFNVPLIKQGVRRFMNRCPEKKLDIR